MKKVRIAIMGFGDRGQIYASYALKNPDKMEVVACIDPNPIRIQIAKQTYNLKDNMCFTNPDDFYKREKLCDAVINATMDSFHIKTTLPLLDKGYDILLEKPITSNIEELKQLQQKVKETNRKVMICHVLRYAPFYVRIKKILMSGKLGKIENMYCSENVAIPHMLSSYIRGKWGSQKECGSSMLMAKCCHDIDMIVWLKEGAKVEEVSSFGERSIFCSSNKPKNAGTRCMVDCPIEKDCPYSAKKLYIQNDVFPFLVWANIKGKDWREVTKEEKEYSLKTSNSNGLCAYNDKDLVDHQSVMIKFKDGCLATLNMVGGSSRPGRNIHIVCENGEIQGFLESNEFVVRKYNKETTKYDEQKIEITEDTSGVHSGGDLRLVDDFIKYISGKEKSISCTDINDSIQGHLITIGADISRTTGKIFIIDKL